MRRLILTLLTLAILGVVVWSSWDRIAVHAAPEKRAAKVRSDAALKADSLFWQTFHKGDYYEIQNVLETLTAAYLGTPEDAKTAAHIAWLHIWRISERRRVDEVAATATDDVMLARRYFQEAVELDPSDARYLGFLAGTTMAEGNLHKDERLTRKGYFMLRDSIRAWPEFNLFTGGYIMSRLPSDSPRFREGLEWQWRTLDECAEERVDRANPIFSKYMSKETKEGPKRACWNSWIAPHNFEGFFLNMGDMLVKAGDWQTARKIYANAKLSHEYPSWKFSSVLDDRIEHAQENVALFNPTDATPVTMMINSEFSCTGCHQR
jgi:tetratricopeptide (TPR) repeat protein